MLRLCQLTATLYDDLVAGAAIVLLIMAMEVLVPRDPEADLVVPVVARNTDCHRLLIEALLDDSSVHLLAIGGELDEACPQGVAQVPNVGRH